MPSTRRSSARIAAQSQNSSSPQQPKSSPTAAASKKRKNEAQGSSPSAKRGKKHAEPEQKTLEETIENGDQPKDTPTENVEKEHDKPEQTEAQQANGDSTSSKKEEEKRQGADDDTKMTGTEGDDKAQQATKEEGAEPAEPEQKKEDKDAASDEPKKEENTKQEESKEKPSETNGDAVIAEGRDDNDVPSSILEKGIIYFFFRARVNVDDPQDVNDIARTYIVMRPLPLDAKLGDGPIGDEGNCRLLALPKKVLPQSGRDRFMAFVEKAKTGFKELKESFMAGSEHETKTSGKSHVPPATPLAEGVYAITSTGRESHLAYIITIPSELGEVQKELGLHERGSFIMSVKNPTQPQPSNTNLPKDPEYPKEILDEFGSLRWKPLEPKYLDYPNAQVLIIGGHWDKATEQRPKDDRENNAPPEEELEKLEGEDEIRVKHLKGDDAVFADLGISSKDFPKVPTTW
ncbi:hypothetical protein KCU88_g1222, partial [Aureobasidium melanogenum]